VSTKGKPFIKTAAVDPALGRYASTFDEVHDEVTLGATDPFESLMAAAEHTWLDDDMREAAFADAFIGGCAFAPADDWDRTRDMGARARIRRAAA
jgi:hypothetical protein